MIAASAFVVLAPLWLLVAKLCGQYDRDHKVLRHLTVDEIPSIVFWALSVTATMTVVLLPLEEVGLTDSDRLYVWLLVIALAIVFRSGARRLWRMVTPAERALIVGQGELSDMTARKTGLFPDIHVEVRCRVSSVDELAATPALLQDVDRIVLACDSLSERAVSDLLPICRRDGIKLSVVPPVRAVFGTATQLSHVAELPVLDYNTWDISRSTLFMKRALDFGVAVLALVLLAPLFVLVALAILATSGRPVLFSQRRAGQSGRPFRMWKFRTMVADAEARLDEVVSLHDLEHPMFKLRFDPRTTRLGRLLRRTSLDELPQLLNVLRGDMSLVGPRPEQLELVERYEPEHLFRLAVKPGLTGPMQIYGRGELTFQERLAVEREYIESLSLGRDLRILGLTIPVIVSGRGAF